jgi:hypothetical protein
MYHQQQHCTTIPSTCLRNKKECRRINHLNTKRDRSTGCGETLHLIQGEGQKIIALKVPKRCMLVLLPKVELRQCGAQGSGDGTNGKLIV